MRKQLSVALGICIPSLAIRVVCGVPRPRHGECDIITQMKILSANK